MTTAETSAAIALPDWWGWCGTDTSPDALEIREGVTTCARATFVTAWEYRFMYRELIALLRRDAQLHRRWVEIRARGFEGFHELFNLFVAAGVLHDPADPAVVTRLAELVWLISEFWLASVELGGQTVDAAQMEHGVELMLQVLGPFVVDQAA